MSRNTSAFKKWFLALKLVLLCFSSIGNAEPGGGGLGTLSDEKRALMNQAILEQIVRAYNTLSTPADFERVFLQDLSVRDRNDLVRYIRKLKTMPALSREGTTLVFSHDKVVIRLDWPDVRKTEFRVNGIFWTLNKREPLIRQIGLLERKIELQGRLRSALYSFALPSAEASPATPVIAALGGVVEGVVNNEAFQTTANGYAERFKKEKDYEIGREIATKAGSDCRAEAMKMFKELLELMPDYEFDAKKPIFMPDDPCSRQPEMQVTLWFLAAKKQLGLLNKETRQKVTALHKDVPAATVEKVEPQRDTTLDNHLASANVALFAQPIEAKPQGFRPVSVSR